MDFRIHAAFAHATRNQLRVLSAKIEDQHAMRVDVGLRCRGDIEGLGHVVCLARQVLVR